MCTGKFFPENEEITNQALTMSSDAAGMRYLVLTILMWCMLGGWASAGAWLRDQGTVFAATSVTAFKEHDTYRFKTSLYAEWGFRPNLTLGLDAEEHQDLYGHALIFGRFPVADFGKAGRLAGEIGVGAHHRQLRTWALYKATLSYGKNIQTGLGNGWLAVDTALEYRTHDALIRKLDLTAGLSSGRRFDPLLQVETSYIPDQPFYWSVRPSVIYRPKSGKTAWIVGAERNALRDSTGFKFALWLTY